MEKIASVFRQRRTEGASITADMVAQTRWVISLMGPPADTGPDQTHASKNQLPWKARDAGL